MNKQYFVIPGKTPDLSLFELKQQLPHLSKEHQPVSSISREAFEIKSAHPLTAEQWNVLGGIMKAGEVMRRVTEPALFTEVLHMLEAKDVRDIGVSFYGSRGTNVAHFALSLKKKLKASGAKVRIVFPQTGTALPAVVTQKQLLNKRGVELCIMQSGKEWVIGETHWVHQFEDWGTREFGKPVVDRKRGLLPHKLARMMINCAGLKASTSNTIYDPFCGSGVVLLEARELGYTYCGSDLDEKAVAATKDNLGLPDDSTIVWQDDARTSTIPEALLNGNGAIITEPYLGPVWFGAPSNAVADKVMHELQLLYSETLWHWKQHLPSGVPIVMIFPVIFGRPTFSKTVDSIRKLKYSSYTEPIRYERSDAAVGRDIVRLTV